jgi:hypothetical protein
MTNRVAAFNVVDGVPVPDVGHLDGPAALARKREVEGRLTAIKGDLSKLDEREALKRENGALDARLRAWRDEEKQANARRNFAGVGSPLHEVLVERHPELAPTLEALALQRLAERERRSAERKAAKASTGGA